MKFARKYLLPIGGVLVVISAVTLFTPRTVHAFAAALVQVTNTLANPAVTEDSSRAASQIVVLQIAAGDLLVAGHEVQMVELSPTQGPSPKPYTVPAGQNLVLTGVDFNVYGADPNNEVFLEHFAPPNLILVDQIYSLPSAGHQQFPLASGVVVPAGSSVILDSAGSSFIGVVVHGYLTAN